MKIKPISKSFRLIEFNVYDEHKGNSSLDEGKKVDQKEFMVQTFGLNEKGETCSIFIEGFKPFFYVKIPDDWTNEKRINFINSLKEGIKADWEEEGEEGYYDNSITKSKIIKRKKLYGFDGGKKHKFLYIEFANTVVMNKIKNLWYEMKQTQDGKRRKLKKKGYLYDCDFLELYEGNIPPLLRLFHIKNISPSGWVQLPVKKTITHIRKRKTTCNYEFTINYDDIKPLPNKETIAPYKMCSFDIEASSSHGDFPLAKKTYKKLAVNIVDIWRKLDEYDYETETELLENIIHSAFGFSEYWGVDKVYPKRQVTEEYIVKKTVDFIKCKPALLEKNPLDEEDEGEEEENNDAGQEEGESFGNSFWKKKKNKKYSNTKNTPLDILNDETCDRETKITEINKALNHIFPKLEGDKVTFIGSTFIRYGQEKPYMNHCIVLDSCSTPDNIENCIIETYHTEKEVLLAWTKLIQSENPDLLTGYNIFGFDYQFMFQRAEELGCLEEFLKLSRNKGEICASRDFKTHKLKLEENSIIIASGQHDLKFIKMNGRLQVDMYNFFRRDYNLVSYKLDYVSGHFIGDKIKDFKHYCEEDDNKQSTITKVYSKNLTGLENGSWVNFEEISHSSDMYKDGKKFEVSQVDYINGTFVIQGNEQPDMTKTVRWGLAKDDVTPQDIFRMTNEGPDERAIIAKYCIQDCNLVHHLIRKIDVMTGYIEMAKLCSVPMNFLVMRGQGIKLQSYIAKKCREKETLLPVIEKPEHNSGYEGAIVLPPKCDLYLDTPVACVDYSSLYPSSMISENLSHDSKVWTKEYDLNGKLISETGEKDEEGEFIYDNLSDYQYVDVEYDTYQWKRKTPSAAAQKIKCGTKVCRFAQFPDGKKACLPSILEELLAARKATRREIPNQKDDFMKNVLDKRQLSIKVTANSLYGQTGAGTSSFYEVDVAASTTAVGRKLLTYARRVIEETYKDCIIKTKNHGTIKVNAEYVYGDTDSVFFKFNPEELDGTPIKGQKALEITIDLAQDVGEMATKFLKKPHDLEYEKTFMPFCLLSKKRYVGMLYELDATKCYRKSMGIVLKRRDNAPIVKDVYGGIIDILMKDKDIEKAIEFLKSSLTDITDEKCGMDKLIITKSLRSNYKNPQQIAHKVLADRMGKRDPGNKPSAGDRIPFAYVHTKTKSKLQGDKIEHPDFIREKKLKINYSFYISNQIMKPVQQIFALVLEKIPAYKTKKNALERKIRMLERKHKNDDDKRVKTIQDFRNKEVKILLFDHYLRKTSNVEQGNQAITGFFNSRI